jgi:hypothetical protein
MEQKKQTEKPRISNTKLEEGIDFYYNESGYFVFTEFYLKKRGYCCKNKCKHCPYGMNEG